MSCAESVACLTFFLKPYIQDESQLIYIQLIGSQGLQFSRHDALEMYNKK